MFSAIADYLHKLISYEEPKKDVISPPAGPVTKPVMMNKLVGKDKTQEMLELVTRAACHLYADDPTCPSIVHSYLKTNVYYLSVVRYRRAYAKDKFIVYKTTNRDLAQGLMSVAAWLSDQAPVKKNPIDALTEFMEENGSQNSQDIHGAPFDSMGAEPDFEDLV